ncbi:MAG: radical SAM protein [Nanoarchaeota archaeon]
MGIAGKLEETGAKAMGLMPRIIRNPVISIANAARLMRIKRLKTPINLTLYVTSRCNANCKHCFYKSELNKKEEELSLQQIKTIAKTLKHPLKTLMITGGEPFLRNDVPEICGAFLKNNRTRRISIATNGMLTQKIIESVKTLLKSCRQLHVQISLDGPEDIHDNMRAVEGCYQKATATLRELEILQNKHKNFQVSILTTICKLNYRHLAAFSKGIKKEFPSILHKFNIVRGSRTGTFGLPEDITSSLETEAELLTPKELESLFNELSKNVSGHKDDIWAKFQKLKWFYSIEMLRSRKKLFNCLAGHTFGVIYSNGNVSMCEPSIPFANLKDYDYNFYKLWNSKKAKEMRKKLSHCFCIHPCNLLDSMAYDTKSIQHIFNNKN